MKNILKTITAVALALVMTAISPMTDLSQSLCTGNGTTGTTTNGGAMADSANSNTTAPVAKAAEKEKIAESDSASGELYISEVKIGQGKTEAEARKELTEEGFTILTDDSGKPADLNKGAGEKGQSGFGPGDCIVYLGYKVTDDPKQAITDLAAMNMKGGYSVQDYEIMMETQLETQIKPFINRFITTINEYRENLKKPKDSLNYVRADFSRKMLNYLVDDDTGKSVGDLLVEETKFEMGDDAYNALSDTEKKNHADIVTILMQGNGNAILTMESMLAMAADTQEDSWFERFMGTDLDTLAEEVMTEKPSLSTKAEVNAELDKKYQDSAKQLLKSWEAMGELLDDPETLEEEALDAIDEHLEEKDEIADRIEDLNKDSSDEEIVDTVVDDYIGRLNMETDVMNLRAGMIGLYLETYEYGNGTALDFFQKDAADFTGSNIRELYPIVASLSEGQIAGLEFLSLMDLLAIAFQDTSAYDEVKIADMEKASVYEDVDREIYEPGGVAVTNDALRKQSLSDEQEMKIGPMIKPLTYAKFAATLVSGIITIVCYKVYLKKLSAYKNIGSATDEVLSSYNTNGFTNGLAIDNPAGNEVGNAFKAADAVDEIDEFGEPDLIPSDEVEEALNQSEAAKGATDMWKGLSIAFSIITLALLAYSVYTSIMDMINYYHVDFTPIPKFMVEETDITAYNDKGERIVINNQTAYYRIVTCNRKEGKTEREKDAYSMLGDRSDLNGGIGRQWLALYSVKYRDGEPILADSLKYVTGDLSGDYATGIHEFGGKAPMNLNKKAYLFADEPPAIYVCFKKAAHSVSSLLSAAKNPGAAGSLFAEDSAGGTGSGSRITPAGLALGGGIGIVLGALLMALILYFARRKRVSEKE